MFSKRRRRGERPQQPKDEPVFAGEVVTHDQYMEGEEPSADDAEQGSYYYPAEIGACRYMNASFKRESAREQKRLLRLAHRCIESLTSAQIRTFADKDTGFRQMLIILWEMDPDALDSITQKINQSFSG